MTPAAPVPTLHDDAVKAANRVLQRRYEPPEQAQRFQSFLATHLHNAFDAGNPAGAVVCSALLIDDIGENLLMWHDSETGAWSCVGGPVDPSDATLLDAALRHARGIGLRDIDAFGEFPLGIEARAPDSFAPPGDEWDLDGHLTYNIAFLVVVQGAMGPYCVLGEERDLCWVSLCDIGDNIPRTWSNLLDILAPKIVPQTRV